MKKTIRVFLLLTVFRLLPFAAAAPDDDRAKAAAFFNEVRMNFAQSAGFGGGWVADSDRDALLKTYDENKPDEFIARSGPWLQKCPVDAKVHLMRSNLLIRAGDVSGHFYHRLAYYGLMASIAASGDGKTQKSAYKVISVDEEYAILNHIGAKVKSQKLVGGPCDAMTVEWNGKESVVYFDVSIPMSAMQKELDAAGKK